MKSNNEAATPAANDRPMHPMNQLDRITHAIAVLTRAYRRRKTTGRPYGHLLTRCRRLSGAWLDARHEQLTNPTR